MLPDIVDQKGGKIYRYHLLSPEHTEVFLEQQEIIDDVNFIIY